MSETEGARAEGQGPRGRTAEAPPEMPRKERPKGGGSTMDPEAWMVTFSDLLTLLMTFFVLIFASQDPVPPAKLHEAFGQTRGVFSLFRTGFLERIAVVSRSDISQDRVQVFLDEIGAVDIDVEQQEGGLVVTLPSDTYFEPGSARVNERARRRIDQLAAYLSATPHRIRVEGHTDNQERAQPPYASVWELSVARAHRVMVRLTAQGVAEGRMALAGYGPARPRFDNVSRVGRSRNRRVEIVILNRRSPPPQP